MNKFYSKSTGGFYSADVHNGDQIPTDAVQVPNDAYAALFAAQAAGKVIQPGEDGAPVAVDRPGPTPTQSAASLSRAIQAHIDATARGLGYDNILAACSYADDATVPAFQAQGQALRAWRANVWTSAIPVLDAIRAGSAPVQAAPILIATLPAFKAPTIT